MISTKPSEVDALIEWGKQKKPPGGKARRKPIGGSSQPELVEDDERLARMRKSFKKDRSILAEDYKYFTTPDASAKQHGPIHRSKAAHMSGELSVPKSPKRS